MGGEEIKASKSDTKKSEILQEKYDQNKQEK
jgi:hypothetical protein